MSPNNHFQEHLQSLPKSLLQGWYLDWPWKLPGRGFMRGQLAKPRGTQQKRSMRLADTTSLRSIHHQEQELTKRECNNRLSCFEFDNYNDPFFSWPTSINYIIKNWRQVTNQHFEHQKDGLSYGFEHLVCNVCVSVQIRCTLSLFAVFCDWLSWHQRSFLAWGACTHAVLSLAPIKVYTCLSKLIPHDLIACRSIAQLDWGKLFF